MLEGTKTGGDVVLQENEYIGGKINSVDFPAIMSNGGLVPIYRKKAAV